MRYIFESIPIIIALLAIFSAANCLVKTDFNNIRVGMGMIIFSSTMLIIAQTSWSMSILVLDTLIGTEFANYVWTVFNISTMLTFSYIIYILSDY